MKKRRFSITSILFLLALIACLLPLLFIARHPRIGSTSLDFTTVDTNRMAYRSAY